MAEGADGGARVEIGCTWTRGRGSGNPAKLTHLHTPLQRVQAPHAGTRSRSRRR
ncbi:hypothetical protein C8Q70DRAFT_1013427 [Cubamyces menziesii]|nr:hypothetical protein C8Q70DRAFT_1013416 [Cubamyces menziesii]KAI0656269.1 hypothetical protein C8Q70DRAFT_1013427 [Cubamyces menziesii]